MKKLIVVAVVVGLCLITAGCATLAGMGNDWSDAANGYAEFAGRRVAAQQAYQDGLAGISYADWQKEIHANSAR